MCYNVYTYTCLNKQYIATAPMIINTHRLCVVQDIDRVSCSAGFETPSGKAAIELSSRCSMFCLLQNAPPSGETRSRVELRAMYSMSCYIAIKYRVKYSIGVSSIA